VICRRSLLQAGAAAAVLPRVALAQNKPEKLVFVGDNGPWHWCLVEEVAPAFEKQHGIKVDFTLLPIDALSARLKAELNSGSSGIDVIQWTATYAAGWRSIWRTMISCWPTQPASTPILTGTISCRRSATWPVIRASCWAFRIASPQVF
jgi:ABC-type glycerol-3-phosphate transport system substrate-binding protein